MRDEASRRRSAGTIRETPSRAAESPGSTTPQQPLNGSLPRGRVLPPGSMESIHAGMLCPQGVAMSTAPLFDAPGRGPSVSFELYPPRTPRGEETVRRTVAALAEAEPDFFSVTYGASGSTRATSRELIEEILATTSVTPLAHLTCVGASAEDLGEYIGTLLERGVRDFLALRGDPPAGEPDWRPHPHGLTRSAELVRLLRTLATDRHPEERVSVSVATYPGGAYDAAGRATVLADDVAALVEKQAAGADFAITQLFYDAGHYAEL